ncbi:DUF1499 domain-containing protein [Paenirhodobacter sp. CAU 1674]|uniref:DUF1499 domain-containing protein n=1 Tax=Paenirhodobacter sp. CAU 1674 TaxID=3032596 RepID=UPI0023D99A6D|nr:DUF1499 domain-containing protein [Paenirhodobacter sp. CAU 1674]MDF2139915.1 DUF1499 domain-containing protein [Paenirhodobacter sp. CAU 1674]
MIRIGLIALVLLVAGFAAWVRLAPLPADRWHKMAATKTEGDWPDTGGFEAVRQIPDPQARLAELGRIVAASPRTVLLEGSVEEGLMTFVTRSAVWGFPDITNLWIEGDRVHIRGHLVFGRSDLGVNRDRILGWLGRAGL